MPKYISDAEVFGTSSARYIPEDEVLGTKPESRSILDIVSGGISAVANDWTSGRAAIRKRERDEAIARGNEAAQAMIEDQQASGTADELQRRADQIAATRAAQNSPINTAANLVRDTGINLARGAGDIGQAATGLTAMPLDMVGALDPLKSVGVDFRGAQHGFNDFDKWAAGFLSDAGKAKEAKLEATKGFTDTLVTLGTDPRLMFQEIVKSLPGTLAAGKVGEAAVGVYGSRFAAEAKAAGLTGEAAQGFISEAFRANADKITRAAMIGAAAGEGAQQAGGLSGKAQAESIPFKNYVIPAVASGALDAVISLGSNKIANKIGIGDIETDIALRKTGVGAGKTSPAFWLNRGVIEGIKEGALEEMPQSVQEAIAENIAFGRPWDQGIGKAAAQGLATGFGMGAGHAVISRQNQDSTGSGQGVPSPSGAVPAADVLEAPAAKAPEQSDAEKALFAPKSLTALDRVAEIDAKLPMATAEESSALQSERDGITASWPKSSPGAATSFSTETGARLNAQYALMEVGDLTTSHDESLRPVTAYPQELQPRERDRHASEAQISGIVQKLDPARLGEAPDAGNGAPIVGADGLVESGNARTIALKRVYQANGQKAEDYRQFLRQNADRFGVLPADIDAMQKPVLVRVRQTPVNRAEFARQANASTVARMSPAEQARSDAAQIDSLDDLNPTEAGDFSSSSSDSFIRRFMAKLPVTESAGLVDASGRLSQSGYTRVRNAVLAKAYGDSPVLQRMTESLDDSTRNVSKALLRVAPQVAKAREAISEGALFDSDITPDLLAAVEELSALKDKGVSVREANAQAGMFGDKLSPEARQILALLDESARSPKRIAEFIQNYIDALTAAGNPAQGSMFGEAAAPGKGDLLAAARKASDDKPATATGSADAGNAKPAEEGRGQSKDAPRDQAGNGSNEASSRTKVADGWKLFGPETGTIGIPRADMPQIKGEHRGALIQFLAGKGITHERVELPASDLKPTQAEYSPEKVAGWAESRDGVDRSVLASSDGYILDGHHQWVYARDAGETEQVIRFSVPIRELLAATFQFPSVKRSEGANVVELRARNQQDLKDAMADLAAIATKHTRAAMLPENTPNLMPTLIKLSTAAIKEVGYQAKDIIAKVKQLIRSNAEFGKVWNKIDNALYRKAALKAAEQESAQRVDDLFAMAEERKGQGDLFSNPQPEAKPKQVAPPVAMIDGRPYDMKRDNYKPEPASKFVNAGLLKSANDMIDRFFKGKTESPISDEARSAAENGLRPILEKAAADKAEFDQAIIDVAEQYGVGQLIAPLKGIGRAAEKVVQDYDGDVSKIADLLRATVVVERYEDAGKVVAALIEKYGADAISKIKNKTGIQLSGLDEATAKRVINQDRANFGGYSDVSLIVKTPGGVLAEVQINVPAMMAIKDAEGHKLYEAARSQPKGSDQEREIDGLMKQVYDDAFASATRLDSAAEAKNPDGSKLTQMPPRGPSGGMDGRASSDLPSSESMNHFPSGNSTKSSPLNVGTNLQPSGNLAGTFIASTPFTQSIAKSGGQGYTESTEKSSGGENGQNGDTGSRGAQGKEPGTASATGGPGPAEGVRDGAGGRDQRPDRNADDATGAEAGAQQGKKPGGGRRNSKVVRGGGDGNGLGGNAGVPAGRDIPAKTGRNFAFGDGDLTYSGSWQTKARQNVEAVELLKKLEAEGRQATRDEQATLAKFIGWGASEIANSIFGEKLDKQLAALANYDEAIQNLGDRPYLTNARYSEYRPAFELLQAKNPSLNWYTAGNITKAMLDSAKPDSSAKKWGELRDRLKAVMSKEEWDAASRSTQYAHYTSKPVVKALLGAVSKMGFKGGTILEPGAGIGVFPGLMSSDMATNSIYTGVEFDPITGGILKQLFPDERILVESFIDSKLPENFYDVAFGNPPFGGFKVLADPKYAKQAFALHDYFFAKSLDSVKPGGLLVFVTSRYTMDKKGDKARAYMGERADLVGAIRLPQTAFQKNAGTEVVTDILFLRKKVPGQSFDQAQPWMGLGEVKTDKEPALINEYFASHPEMVMGKHALAGSMYSKNEYTVLPNGGDIEAQIAAAVENLPADVFVAGRGSAAEAARVRDMDFNPKALKEGSFYVSDAGVLMQREGGVGVRADDKYQKNAEVLKDYVGLRDAVKQAQFDQLNDGDWESSLTALQKAYSRFVAKHGRLLQNTPYTQKVKVDELDDEGVPTGNKVDDEEQRLRFPLLSKIKGDTEWTLVAELERLNEETGEVKDSEWLTKRTLNRPTEAEVKTPADALLAVLNDTGTVDIAEIADRIGMEEQETIDALGSLIYEDPTQGWVMADEYLSGNVKKKLAQAEEAARNDKAFARNIEALKAVQPAPRSPEQITPQIGMNWIPGEVYEQFLLDVTGVKAKIEYVKRTRDWVLTTISGEGSPRATSDWGVGDKAHAGWLMEKTLTGAAISLNKSVSDGKGGSKLVFDPDRTEAANEKRAALRAKFREWLFQDADRTTALVQLYNDKFNTNVQRKFDGKHLTLPGTSKLFDIFDHVKRGAWRVIQTGNTYLAHAVGSGKTFEMVISAMEQKRLGLIKKPMVIVPGHMLQQFASEWQQLYPTARLMVADETDFHTDNRRRFVSRVAMSDLDGVIMTHSSFGLLDLDPEFKKKMIEKELDVLRASYEEAGGNLDDIGDKKVRKEPKVKRIEAQIEKLEQQLAKATSSEGKDKNVRFDEMGVDMLYVDEAHLFRKLSFATARQTKGIDPNGSQMAWDLYMKTRWLAEKNPTRNLVMASGTAITNTTAELYTVQRFMAPQVLEENGLAGFDDWASQFGEESTTIESTASGKYEPVSRFQNFVNVGEMTQMFRDFADVLNEDHLAALLGDKRPKVKGGARKSIITPKTDSYKEFLKDVLAPRIEASRKWKPSFEQQYNPDPIIAINIDARLAAIDMRFMDPSLPSDPDSKLNQMIDGVIRIYKETENNAYRGKSTKDKDGKEVLADFEPIKGATQMVFFETGFGQMVAQRRGFNARAWMEKRLRDAGIPASQLAFMEDYKKSSAKLKLFSDVNKGKVRVLVGSSAAMGTGVNAQQRLIALHHLDAPYVPAILEQREGRIIRQGNKNPEVQIYAYSMFGSFDENQWGMLARKKFFIEQAMSGDPNIRSIEDVGEVNQLQLAAGLVAENPYVMQHAGAKAEVDKLTRLYRNHEEQRARMREDYQNAGRTIEYNESQLPGAEKAAARVKDLHGDLFAAKADGKEFTKRKEWGEAILERFKGLTDTLNTKEVKLGEISGFDLVATGSVFANEYRAGLMIKTPTPVTLAHNANTDPGGLATRAVNALVDLSREPARMRKLIEEMTAKRASLESRLDAPFPLAEQLANKVKETADLEQQMMNYGKEAPAALNFDAYEWANATTMFSRGTGSGMALRDLQAVVDRVSTGFKNLPRVHVMESPASLSTKDPAQKALRDYIRKSGAWDDVEGATHDGEIYLFASGLADEARAEHVLATHEVTHYGLRGAIGKDLDSALQHVLLMNAKVRKAAVQLKERLGLKSNLDAVEEVLADLTPADLVKLRGWRKVVQVVRNWLNRAGAKSLAAKLDKWIQAGMSDQEKADLYVTDLVTAARDWVKSGKGRATVPGTKLAEQKLADDWAAQEQWLAKEARARGYQSIDELAEKAYPVFEKLAALWREKHPADALLSRSRFLPKVSPQSMLDEDIKAGTEALTKAISTMKDGKRFEGSVTIGRLPHVMSMLGTAVAPDLEIDRQVIHKVFINKAKHADEFSGITPEQFVRAIYQPAMVFSDKRNSSSFVIVTDLVGDKGAVIVPIILGKSEQKEAAVIASAYQFPANGTDKGDSLTHRLDEGKAVYVDLAKAKVALTGRTNEQARNSGPGESGGPNAAFNTSGLIRQAPATVTLSSNIANQPSPVNKNFVAWGDVSQQLRNMIAQKEVKTDLDLVRWIGDNYKPKTSPKGWGDVPAFSRSIRNSQTANKPTADDIINQKAATARPVDAVLKGITQAVRLDRLTTAAFNKGAFFLDRFTPETIKAGLVSDYGIPEAVIDQRAVTQGKQKQQLREAGALLEKLATLTRAESRVAYQWMNSDDPQSSDYFMDQLPPESVKVLAEVEKMIDALSKEAVALGQLSPDAYQRNRFAYLRRSYVKHTAELTQGEAKMRSRAISILGDQYKGRGMTDSTPMKRVQNVAPEWWGRKTQAGKADKGLKGEKFIRLEKRAPVGSGTVAVPGTGGKQVKPRLLEIAYWPANEPVPARYGSWDQAGTWEVRDTKGADLILWRDFTAQERQAMGEIDEVRYAVAKTLHGMIHDVETGKYLQWLGQQYAKKEGEKIDGTIVEASDRMRDVFKPGEWVKVPETVIPGTKVKKYGTLAGRYLPGPIWNDVRQVVGFRYQPLGETYAAIHRAWKTSKTALSPAVHMNNVMANFVMADWHDVTAGHVLKALKLMVSKDAAAAEVLARFGDSGGTIGTWAVKELQQEQLRPLIESLEKELGLAGNVSGQVGVMSAMQLMLKGRFPSAWEALKPSKPGQATAKAARAMLDLYEAEDQVFRLAAWLRAKEDGATDLAAGKVARKSFLDYSINAPWVQMMRSTFLPFIAFTYRAVPMAMETAAKKPWKLMKLAMFAGAINAMGYMLAGGDEDDERRLLPEEKAGKIWGMVPKLVRMPWNDANGSPVFLDIRRFVPVGDVFDVGQSHAAIPILPGMTPGGPLAVLAEIAMDQSQFTGKKITLETDTAVEKAAKVADHLWKAFTPNLIFLPGTYAFQGVSDAIKGRTDTFGREQSPAQAVISSVGIKVGSYPKDVLRLNAQREMQSKIMEIDRNITMLNREYARKGLTPEQHQTKIADQVAKKVKVIEEFNKNAR